MASTKKEERGNYIYTDYDKRRNIAHWVIYDNKKNISNLIEAHNDISDMFINPVPFVLFEGEPPLNNIGKLSDNAYLISYRSIPEDSPTLLFNREFFKYCVSGISHDDIEDILADAFKSEKLEELTLKYGLCLFIVKGVSD